MSEVLEWLDGIINGNVGLWRGIRVSKPAKPAPYASKSCDHSMKTQAIWCRLDTPLVQETSPVLVGPRTFNINSNMVPWQTWPTGQVLHLLSPGMHSGCSSWWIHYWFRSIADKAQYPPDGSIWQKEKEGEYTTLEDGENPIISHIVELSPPSGSFGTNYTWHTKLSLGNISWPFSRYIHNESWYYTLLTYIHMSCSCDHWWLYQSSHSQPLLWFPQHNGEYTIYHIYRYWSLSLC